MEEGRKGREWKMNGKRREREEGREKRSEREQKCEQPLNLRRGFVAILCGRLSSRCLTGMIDIHTKSSRSRPYGGAGPPGQSRFYKVFKNFHHLCYYYYQFIFKSVEKFLCKLSFSHYQQSINAQELQMCSRKNSFFDNLFVKHSLTL